MRTRDAVLGRLEAGEAPEVLIVGGGINGVGVYRDLAGEGVAALLVERGDFASGTSAAPSRLIHGGLRYLETGEMALVRESVEERNLLLLNAPHVVRPIRCWIPLRSWFGGLAGTVARFLRLTRTPGRKGAVPVKVGLAFYDLFGNAHRTMPRHRFFSRAAALARVPRLAPSTRAVAEYYDARISHPERLTMELVADAEAACPASLAVPYLAVSGLRDGAVELTDRVDGRVFRVRPKVVVNASGAWLDQVHAGLGLAEKLVGGTKGSHLVIRAPDVAAELGEIMLYFETEDHRACLIYRMDEDHVLLGTTDLRTEDPDDTICSAGEIDYLFGVLAAVMPQVRFRSADIVFHYAGVRPLPRTEGAVAGAISRDHSIRRYDPGPERPFTMLSLVGGKWTTYRACAEQIADAVLGVLGRRRTRSTRTEPIGGGRDFPRDAAGRAAFAADLARRSGVAPERAALLADRYGSTAAAIAAAEVADGGRTLAAAPTYSRAEIVAIARDERVTRLEDVVLRRTLMGFEGLAGAEQVAELADVVGDVLGWSAERRVAERDACNRLLRERHGVSQGGERARAA